MLTRALKNSQGLGPSGCKLTWSATSEFAAIPQWHHHIMIWAIGDGTSVPSLLGARPEHRRCTGCSSFFQVKSCESVLGTVTVTVASRQACIQVKSRSGLHWFVINFGMSLVLGWWPVQHNLKSGFRATQKISSPNWDVLKFYQFSGPNLVDPLIERSKLRREDKMITDLIHATDLPTENAESV